MRYGIFSDVHSNYEALESVVRAYASEDIDMFFCVGDVVGYGADPGACIRLIRELPVIVLAGNHDWAVSGRLDPGFFNPEAKDAVLWTQEMLNPGEKSFLDGLRLAYSDPPLTLVHATLNDPAAFNYLTDTTAARETFDVMETRVCFVGHTHVPRVYARDRAGRVSLLDGLDVTVSDSFSYIVNIGSVGQPRDGDPRASFCVYDTATGDIRIRRAGYDVPRAAAKIRSAGLSPYLGERLSAGR